MAYFSSAAEVDCYVGGVLRLAGVHPVVGPLLGAAAVRLAVVSQDPPARLVVSLFTPVTVVLRGTGGTGDDADVELSCDGDVLDRYWRGDYDLLAGMASGEVEARGRVSRVLKVLPSLESLFPAYRRLVASKDARRTSLLLEPS